MKKYALSVVIILLQLKSFGQSFLFSDVGNSILLRPNVGYEYLKEKHSISSAIQWQSNSMYWISEFPQLCKTNGIRLDFSYKYFPKPFFFLESKLRLQSIKAPDVFDGWQIISLYNSKKSIEMAFKIGLRTNQTKKIQSDLSIGIGFNYGSVPFLLDEEARFDGNIPLTDSELLKLYANPFIKKINTVPHVQLRIYKRVKNNSFKK